MSGDSSSTDVSSASSSTPSNANPPSTHKPTATPVIAGSLVGCILLIVCVITILLVRKRSHRLRKERALLALRNYHSTRLPSNQSKSSGQNGYVPPKPLPRTRRSGSSAASSPVQLSCHVDSQQQQQQHHQPHDHHPRLPSPGHQDHRHTQTAPHHQPHPTQSLASIPSLQSQSPRLLSHRPQSQPQRHSTNTPGIDTHHHHHQPHGTDPNVAVPHDHADIARGDDNNKKVGRASSPEVIFGLAGGSDADVRTTREERGGGPSAGLPTIVVTRDMEDGGVRGGKERSESPSMIGNGKEVGRNWVLEGNDGFGHANAGTHGRGREREGGMDHDGGGEIPLRSHGSGSGTGYHYLASGSGSHTDNANGRGMGLRPESAGQGSSYARPRTASGSTSGSSIPSSLFPNAAPPSPTTSIASSARNISPGNDAVVGASDENTTTTQQQQQLNMGRNTVVDDTLLGPGVIPLMGRTYVGFTQATTQLTGLGVEEDAPPAYDQTWASERREEERCRRELKRRREQGPEVGT